MAYGELFRALRQRKIVQTVIVYVGGSWGILQALSLFQSTYGWPRAVIDVSLWVLGCGFAAAATIAWFHGERGHQRVTRLELAILVPLLALAVLGSWGLVARRPPASDAPTPAENTLVVLPFVNSTRDTSLQWLQRGMVEMLTTDLAQSQRLHVVSGQRVFDLLRQQGAAEAGIVGDSAADAVARQAGAGYLVRGAVFRAGRSYRLDAELVRLADETVAVSAEAVGPAIFPLVDSLAARLTDRLVAAAPDTVGPRPLAVLTTPSVDAFREYHEGLQALRGSHTREAEAHFRRALALDSTFAQARLRLGLLELAAGDDAAARADLARAQGAADGGSARDRGFARALAMSADRNMSPAIAAFERLARRYPDDKEVWLWLARAYALDPARGADRERALRQVLRLDPVNALAFADLAREYARRGDWTRADSCARLYVALAPDQPEPLLVRGEILESAGRDRDARLAYLEALRLGPEFAPALVGLARADERADQVEQAAADVAPYRASPDTAMRLRARLLTADLLLWRGRVDPALDSLVRIEVDARALNPRLRNEALGALIALWALLGDYERVRGTLAPLVQAGDQRWLLPYGAALGDLGRTAELRALAQAARSAQAEPSAGPSGGITDELAAYVAYFDRDWPAAAQAFRTARAARGGGPENVADVREILALLAAGHAQDALPLVAPFDTAAFGSAIRRHTSLYVQARVFEATGAGPAAARAYRGLLRDWGSCIGRFPAYRDAPARLARLTR